MRWADRLPRRLNVAMGCVIRGRPIKMYHPTALGKHLARLPLGPSRHVEHAVVVAPPRADTPGMLASAPTTVVCGHWDFPYGRPCDVLVGGIVITLSVASALFVLSKASKISIVSMPFIFTVSPDPSPECSQHRRVCPDTYPRKGAHRPSTKDTAGMPTGHDTRDHVTARREISRPPRGKLRCPWTIFARDGREAASCQQL